MQTIKADTKAWRLSQALADYKREEQGKSLGQLAKSIEIGKASEIDAKTSSSSNQSTPTKPRGKGFSFKRETKDQKSMTDYFKQKPKEENGHENSNASGDMFIDSDNDEPSLTIHEEMEIDNDDRERYPDENDEKSSNENDEKSSNENDKNERFSDESTKKSSNGNGEKSASPPNTKVDLFGDSDDNEELPQIVTESKVNEMSNNNNSFDAGKNDLCNKLEAKISQLTQVLY